MLSNPSRPAPAWQWVVLLAWVVFCFAAASSAVWIMPGEWYASLRKPTWNPPSWLFGPVWSTLYLMMAIAAWLVWREGGWAKHSRALSWFVGQWLLNALWTPLFFGLHRPDLALVEIVVFWGVLAFVVQLFWKIRPLAGALLVPYLAWVSFATVLNATLWWLNR
jgi:tryptophan-rich sensory protein